MATSVGDSLLVAAQALEVACKKREEGKGGKGETGNCRAGRGGARVHLPFSVLPPFPFPPFPFCPPPLASSPIRPLQLAGVLPALLPLRLGGLAWVFFVRRRHPRVAAKAAGKPAG